MALTMCQITDTFVQRVFSDHSTISIKIRTEDEEFKHGDQDGGAVIHMAAVFEFWRCYKKRDDDKNKFSKRFAELNELLKFVKRGFTFTILSIGVDL